MVAGTPRVLPRAVDEPISLCGTQEVAMGFEADRGDGMGKC